MPSKAGWAKGFQFDPKAQSTDQTSKFGGTFGCCFKDSLSFLVLTASLLLFASLSPLPLLALGKVRNGGRAGRQGQKDASDPQMQKEMAECAHFDLSLVLVTP